MKVTLVAGLALASVASSALAHGGRAAVAGSENARLHKLISRQASNDTAAATSRAGGKVNAANTAVANAAVSSVAAAAAATSTAAPAAASSAAAAGTTPANAAATSSSSAAAQSASPATTSPAATPSSRSSSAEAATTSDSAPTTTSDANIVSSAVDDISSATSQAASGVSSIASDISSGISSAASGISTGLGSITPNASSVAGASSTLSSLAAASKTASSGASSTVDALAASASSASASAAAVAHTEHVATIKKNVIISIAAIAGSVALVYLIWTIVRKTVFSPSRKFNDRIHAPSEFSNSPGDRDSWGGSDVILNHDRSNSAFGGPNGREMYAPSIARSDSGSKYSLRRAPTTASGFITDYGHGTPPSIPYHGPASAYTAALGPGMYSSQAAYAAREPASMGYWDLHRGNSTSLVAASLHRAQTPIERSYSPYNYEAHAAAQRAGRH